MPDYEIKMQAVATATVTVYDVENEDEAREIAELEGFEKSDVNELSDFEILDIEEDKPFSLPAKKGRPDAR